VIWVGIGWGGVSGVSVLPEEEKEANIFFFQKKIVFLKEEDLLLP